VALGTTLNEEDVFEDEQPEILSDAPHMKHPYAEFGKFQLVGNGAQTNQFCGRYMGMMGCLREPLHEKIMMLDGVSYAGKIDRRLVHHWCNKPSCPVCYKSGWAVRQAFKIEARLKEASKRFGQIEHLMISLPKKDYGLSLESMRAKVKRLLRERGVIGGCTIWHGFRYNVQDLWYFSPHFHIVGFILGGYGKCRGCKKYCLAHPECDGFEHRTRRAFVKDGYICKVFGRRKTIVGTLYYQLNHSTIIKGVERFHVYTYFGNVSYRKLKVTVEMRKAVCRICKHDLIWIRYHGVKGIVTDRSSPFYERDSFEDFFEDGVAVYVESPKRRSGSYEDY